ncbi:hypothetical protein D3C71_1505130 [compost metagenome]
MRPAGHRQLGDHARAGAGAHARHVAPALAAQAELGLHARDRDSLRHRQLDHRHLERVLVLRDEPLQRAAVHRHRARGHGAGQVAAAGRQQFEVVVLAATAQLRDVAAQHALGQQVLEEAGQLAALGVEQRVLHVAPQRGLGRRVARDHRQRKHAGRRVGDQLGLRHETAQVGVLEQLAEAVHAERNLEDLDVHG